MNRFKRTFACMAPLMGLSLCLVAGCPLAPMVDGVSQGTEPGTYYVDRVDGALSYLELAGVRGGENRWVALAGSGAWYDGPGVYRLSGGSAWSRDENAREVTLDDWLQVYDPPPAVPG